MAFETNVKVSSKKKNVKLSLKTSWDHICCLVECTDPFLMSQQIFWFNRKNLEWIIWFCKESTKKTKSNRHRWERVHPKLHWQNMPVLVTNWKCDWCQLHWLRGYLDVAMAVILLLS